MIIFKHKELGTTISLDEIKRCCNESDGIGKVVLRNSLLATSNDGLKEKCCSQKVYNAKDIPVSNDFIAKKYKEFSDLSTEEIKEILSQIVWSELKNRLLDELERRMCEGE